jgi:hypothetical protein
MLRPADVLRPATLIFGATATVLFLIARDRN